MPISSTVASAAERFCRQWPFASPALKPAAVAGAQNFVAAVGHQHDLARQHIDEFVLADMPMTLARPRARRQPQQVDPELRQPGRIAKPGALARPAGIVIGRRIERADDRRSASRDRCAWPCRAPPLTRIADSLMLLRDIQSILIHAIKFDQVESLRCCARARPPTGSGSSSTRSTPMSAAACCIRSRCRAAASGITAPRRSSDFASAAAGATACARH